jgi:hypothetical protein
MVGFDRKTISGCLILTWASTVSAQTLPDYSGSYLCKTMASAGLRLNPQTQTWNGVVFDPNATTTLMRIETTGETGSSSIHGRFERYQISFKDFGSKNEPFQCVSNYASPKFVREVPIIDGRIRCQSFGTTYLVDLNTNRLQLMFEGAYMDVWTENQDTPYVSVGVCEKVS